ELQTPKPLPTLATTPQPYARRAISPALKVEGVKAVSVTEYVPAAAEVLAWSVVPHAAMPGTIVGVPASRAELLQLPPTGAVASNLITMEVGLPRVSGLMTRSLSLRGNMAETLLVPLITEQGGKDIQHEEYEDILSGAVGRAQGGRAKRGRTRRDRRRSRGR